MSCGQVRQYLDAWLDGELDDATSQRLEQHARGCSNCTALRAQREALIARVRGGATRFAAPARLVQAIEAARAPATRRRSSAAPRWWHTIIVAGACSALSVALTLVLVRLPPAGSDPSSDELVSRHALSLAGPLVELGSRDRHQVKPWFHGKVDFAPVVRDLTSLGFELEGARLERLSDQPAVAVVYRIRNHPINLFVWRALPQAPPSGVVLSQLRGYALARWSDQGLMFAAVSDVDARDLERFARALEAQAAGLSATEATRPREPNSLPQR